MEFIMGVMFMMSIALLGVIVFVMNYPNNPQKNKFVLGVRNRDEFYEEEYKKVFFDIYNSKKSQVKKYFIIIFIIGVILLITPKFIFKISIWMIWFYFGLIALYVPYILGNKELKSLKKTMEIKEDKKTFVETKTFVNIKVSPSFFIPLIIQIVTFLWALLFDLKVVKIKSVYEGTFMATIMLGSFLFVGIVVSLCSLLINHLKSEIISEDSDINANYNRALKRNYINTFSFFNWANAVYMALCILFIYFNILSDLFILISIVGYVAIMLVGTVVYILNENKIEKAYKKETNIVIDDDDYWIYGLLYYNPNDKRVNVKKRGGYGTTVNFASVAGKFVMIFVGVSVLLMVFSIVLLGLYDCYPIDLRINEDKVICHQLRDDYKINFEEIENVSLEKDFKELNASRTNGVGMPELLKGNFRISDVGKCKVFLNPKNTYYIKVVTKDKIYYISDKTDDETKEVYGKIEEELK